MINKEHIFCVIMIIVVQCFYHIQVQELWLQIFKTHFPWIEITIHAYCFLVTYCAYIIVCCNFLQKIYTSTNLQLGTQINNNGELNFMPWLRYVFQEKTWGDLSRAVVISTGSSFMILLPHMSSPSKSRGVYKHF